MLKRLLILTTLLTVPALAANAGGYSAIALKDACISDAPTEVKATMCFATILAARESLGWGAMVVTYRTRTGEQTAAEIVAIADRRLGICVGRDVADRDVIVSVTDYLIATTDLEGVTSARAVFTALTQAYPCP